MTRRPYTLACRTFHCPVNDDIPCYVTLKSSATPQHTYTILLHADLQQIECKACLFTPCQAGQGPQHPLSVLPVSGSALVIIGYGLLLCLLPVRGLKLGNIPVIHPTVLAVPSIFLVLPALFVPITLLTLVWCVPLVLCRHFEQDIVLKHLVMHCAYGWGFCNSRRTSIALETRWSVVLR